MVEDYCRGGEVPLDDETKAKLRQEVVNAFPEHRNQIPLDISLQLLQMVGPTAFLTGRPDGASVTRSADLPVGAAHLEPRCRAPRGARHRLADEAWAVRTFQACSICRISAG